MSVNRGYTVLLFAQAIEESPLVGYIHIYKDSELDLGHVRQTRSC